MEQIVCPTCGKFTPIDYFHPEDLPLDITLANVAGLGRGKGFEVTETWSAIDEDDDEIIGLVKDRLVEILALLNEEGKVTNQDIATITGGENAENQEDQEE